VGGTSKIIKLLKKKKQKTKKTQKTNKGKSKENPSSTDLHYSKCHPEPHPFIFKRKKKLQKQ